MSDAVDMIEALGGELITYRPWGGVARQFKAIVEREPSRVASGPSGNYPVKELEILVPRDEIHGVLTVQKGKDCVSFKRSLGDAQEEEFKVTKIVAEDSGLAGGGGMFRLMVQA